MAYTVEKLSIMSLVAYFIVYIVLHIIFAVKEKELKEKIDNKKADEQDEKAHKIFKFLTRWFPAIYVVFLVAMLYI